MTRARGLNQDFSVENFRKLLKQKDFHGESGYRSISDLLPRIESLEELIVSGKFTFSNFRRGFVNGSRVLSPIKLEDGLVLRKVDDNIKRIFRIKSQNRSDITKLTKLLASEKGNYYVLKTDIKSFYESIDHCSLINSLKMNSLLSNRSKQMLEKYLEVPEVNATKGLPRGICLSSTLSEYYMRTIDKRIKEIEGVYYYGRFVDDIIIFTYVNPRKISNFLREIISQPLRINSAKTKMMASEAGQGINPVDFDFLGYRFKKEDGALSVDIARKKLERLRRE